MCLSLTFIAVYHRTLVRLDDPGHLNWDTEWQVIMYTLAGLGLLFIGFFIARWQSRMIIYLYN